MAEFLGGDCERECPREGRLQHGHIAARSKMHSMRRAPGARVYGRAGTDRATLLHEFGGAEVCAAASRLNFKIKHRHCVALRVTEIYLGSLQDALVALDAEG